MKFLCVKCDTVMQFDQKEDPHDGTLSLHFRCPTCDTRIAMLTNPGETRFVHALGVQIGHEQIASTPLSTIRSGLAETRPEAIVAAGREPVWTEAALRRLAAAPPFVQPIVRKLYSDYARQKGYAEITPAVMNEAREALGMSGM